MKTTRRGLFGLIAGVAGTLALGKGAAEPGATLSSIVVHPSPRTNTLLGVPVIYDEYAWGECRDDWGVEMRAVTYTPAEKAVMLRLNDSVFAKTGLIYAEPMKDRDA